MYLQSYNADRIEYRYYLEDEISDAQNKFDGLARQYELLCRMNAKLLAKGRRPKGLVGCDIARLEQMVINAYFELEAAKRGLADFEVEWRR